MADVHQFLSLGIGSPSSIPHWVLVGLSPFEVPELTAADASPRILGARHTMHEIPDRLTSLPMSARHVTHELPARLTRRSLPARQTIHEVLP